MADYELRRLAIEFGILAWATGGVVFLGLGVTIESLPLLVVGSITLGSAVLNILLLFIGGGGRRHGSRVSNDRTPEYSRTAAPLSRRDLDLIRRAQCVNAGYQRVFAAAVAVVSGLVGTAILVIGACYSSDVAVAIGVCILILGPVIASGRVMMADHCNVISKLVMMLRERGLDLCEEPTQETTQAEISDSRNE